MLKGSKGKVSSKIQQGFTIIEVIIVLVIAAIIMLAVFLVVPQLNRTQRNSRRQSDARRVLAAAEQIASNNSGSYSTVTSTTISDITGTLTDPTNIAYSLVTNTDGASGGYAAANKMSVTTGKGCTVAGSGTPTGTGNVAVTVNQETATATYTGYCVSN